MDCGSSISVLRSRCGSSYAARWPPCFTSFYFSRNQEPKQRTLGNCLVSQALGLLKYVLWVVALNCQEEGAGEGQVGLSPSFFTAEHGRLSVLNRNERK